MSSSTPITPAIRTLIEQQLSPGAVIIDPQMITEAASDASKLCYPPELVVQAQSVADVQTLLRLANQYHFPVIPRGGGSGLAGACLADHGGVVLSTRGLDTIRSIDRANFTMEVEAGVISSRVREAAANCNLFYPPDPAGMDLSTIGGNAATPCNGSGGGAALCVESLLAPCLAVRPGGEK